MPRNPSALRLSSSNGAGILSGWSFGLTGSPRAADAAECYIAQGPEKAMNLYSQKKVRRGDRE